eukprot:1030313-Amphidinium_carterae.1
MCAWHLQKARGEYSQQGAASRRRPWRILSESHPLCPARAWRPPHHIRHALRLRSGVLHRFKTMSA